MLSLVSAASFRWLSKRGMPRLRVRRHWFVTHAVVLPFRASGIALQPREFPHASGSVPRWHDAVGTPGVRYSLPMPTDQAVVDQRDVQVGVRQSCRYLGCPPSVGPGGWLGASLARQLGVHRSRRRVRAMEADESSGFACLASTQSAAISNTSSGIGTPLSGGSCIIRPKPASNRFPSLT